MEALLAKLTAAFLSVPGKWIMAFLASGVGLNLMLRLVNKIDFGPWYKAVEATCRKLSLLGNIRLTKHAYEPFETFFQGILSETLVAANRGFDSDDNASEPEVPEKAPSTTPIAAKLAVLLVLGVLAVGTPARAAELKASVGSLDLILPFQYVEAVYLYDIIGAKSFAGAETVVASIKKFDLTFGAVTDLDWDGTTFLGVRREVPAGVFYDRMFVGLWLGRDFRESLWRGGVKASIPLGKARE